MDFWILLSEMEELMLPFGVNSAIGKGDYAFTENDYGYQSLFMSVKLSVYNDLLLKRIQKKLREGARDWSVRPDRRGGRDCPQFGLG